MKVMKLSYMDSDPFVVTENDLNSVFDELRAGFESNNFGVYTVEVTEMSEVEYEELDEWDGF